MLKCEVPPSPGDNAWLRVSLGKPVDAPKHPHAYLDSYCNAERTDDNPRAMSRNWCWWTRDDRQCLPTGPLVCTWGILSFVCVNFREIKPFALF